MATYVAFFRLPRLPHDQTAVMPMLLGMLPPTCRQPLEQRIRELGHSKDLSGWSDDELPDLLQTLEQAAIRRASAFAIPLQEAA